MPRSTPYVAWSSKNGKLIKSSKDWSESNDIDWRDPGKEVNGKVLHSIAGAEGRPHREEAILIQQAGSESPEACGCCVWDSKTMDCSLVTDKVDAEAARKAKLNDAKITLRDARGGASSKKPRTPSKRRPVTIDIAGDEDLPGYTDDEGLPPVTTRTGSQKGGRVAKKTRRSA